MFCHPFISALLTRKALYIILLWMVLTPCDLPGQGMTSIGNQSRESSQSPPARRQEQPSFTELMGSVGRYFTEKLRGVSGGGTVRSTEWDSNASPRASVLAFYRGMEARLYEGENEASRVEQTLPEGWTVEDPAVRALKAVFDRFGPIPAIDLPGEIDVRQSELASFEVFPYAIDHDWIWQVLGKAPDGIVAVEKQPDGTWRFSEETLAGAEALEESVRSISPVYPSSSDKQVVRRVFGPMFADSPWWSWVVLAASLVAAYLIGGFVNRWMRKAGEILEERVQPMVGNLVKVFAIVAAVVAGTFVVILGTSFIEYSPAIGSMFWIAIRTILLIALVSFVLGLVELIATLLREQFIPESTEYGEMAVTIVQRLFKTVILVILAIFVLENVFGVHIGALITGLGVVGLAISLAGKETTQNLFGAVLIFVNRPFVVGDCIEFEDEIGEVEDVRMQATYIRLLSGELLIVPNMKFISNEVENLAQRQYLRREMNLAIPYDTTSEKVEQAIDLIDQVLRTDEIVEQGRFDLEERPPKIMFSDFKSDCLNLRVYYWYFIGEDGEEIQRNHERGWFSYLSHSSLVNRRVLQAFNESGIEFAFPTQTLHVKSEGETAHPPTESGEVLHPAS